ncbi:hypothetical protein DT019_34300 [Streptomyces sp. SDr-06]|uniref:hypothetical protein n=1 Tax=Streptomyces sp. SDr-06 TaxID=2267702 RepID=UPI000DE9EEB5|nr:hypothetical protein [Streptomyces sp. SDr-06]RCH64259.1 hypothetical protein DT019_34300 [Streptomyces sp. SDr-06]
MSPTPLPYGSVRPASVINEEIRALIEGGGLGSGAYLDLLVEWAAAMRVEATRDDLSPAA